MHAHIHRHTCLRHTRTHTWSNATVVTGFFVPPFPWLNFPFISSVTFIFFPTYLVLVPSQESSFDKYVCYFSAILVKYMQWNEMKWTELSSKCGSSCFSLLSFMQRFDLNGVQNEYKPSSKLTNPKQCNNVCFWKPFVLRSKLLFCLPCQSVDVSPSSHQAPSTSHARAHTSQWLPGGENENNYCKRGPETFVTCFNNINLEFLFLIDQRSMAAYLIAQ